jgi:hypothetical protein
LCPSCIGAIAGIATGWAIAKVVGAEYGWKDAAADATLGAVGAGLVGKLGKLARVAAAADGAAEAAEVTGRVATAELRATHGVSKNRVKDIAADIGRNGIREPLKYVEHGGEKIVVDGNHRLRAAWRLGLKEVPAERVELPFRGFRTPGDLVYTPR